MLTFLRTPLDADELIERAQRHTGLTDFGDTPFQEGLQIFLRACAQEADLSLFGSFGTRWDIGRFLSNLLRLRDEERRAPAILDRSIEQPIFITGLPRSGTTFLHRLLAADDVNCVPRVWQLVHPYPEAGARDKRDRRQQKVARQLRMFEMIAPEFRRMHPIGANSPQECSEITAHVFASLRFDTTYSVPSYRRWLDNAGHLDAYLFHKRFLQHLQYQSARAGRWVLKCPDHVFALSEIRSVYPDARVVFVHRDPLRVLLSVARLTEVLRRPFTRHIDCAALGQQECERWSAGAELMIDAADHEPFADPIFHLHYRDLISDPLDAIERLYRHFGLTLDAAVATRIKRLTASNPNGGYGVNHYRFDTFEINPVVAHERFAHYITRFDIDHEPGGKLHDCSPVQITQHGCSAGTVS
jgi:Sulfotransferase family